MLNCREIITVKSLKSKKKKLVLTLFYYVSRGIWFGNLKKLICRDQSRFYIHVSLYAMFSQTSPLNVWLMSWIAICTRHQLNNCKWRFRCGWTQRKELREKQGVSDVIFCFRCHYTVILSLHFVYCYDWRLSYQKVSKLSLSISHRHAYFVFANFFFFFLYDRRSVRIVLQPLSFCTNSYLIFQFIIINNGTNKK